MTQAASRTDKILVVDDDARIRDLLRRYLTQEGFEVILAEDGKALNRLMQGRTVIAIAHRLSTLRNFDRIVVIKDGKVIENGAPKVLIATGGHFSRLLRKEETWLSSQAA